MTLPLVEEMLAEQMVGKTIKTATLNVAGLEGHLPTLVRLIEQKDIHFLVITETWYRPTHQNNQFQDHIVMDIRSTSNSYRGEGGILVLRNPNLTKASDFTVLFTHPKARCGWFKYGNTIFGAFYLNPTLSKKDDLEAIRTVNQFRPFINQVVMLGDFNWRRGRLSNDSICTKRHLEDELVNLPISYVHPVPNPNGIWTFRRTVNGQDHHSIVDHCWISTEHKDSAIFCSIDTTQICESDHCMVHLHLEDATRAPQVLKLKAYWNIKKLSTEEGQDLFDQFVEEHEDVLFEKLNTILEPIMTNHTLIEYRTSQSAIDSAWNCITKFYIDAMKASIGKTRHRVKQQLPFWDESLAIKEHLRRKAYRDWKTKQETNDPEADQLKTEFQRLKKEFKKEVRQKKWKFMAEQQQDMEDMPQHLLQKVVARRKKFKQQVSHACPLPTNRENMEEYHQHFQNQYTARVEYPRPRLTRMYADRMLNISRDTIAEAIKMTPSHKAAGIDQLKVELFQCNKELAIEIFYILFSAITRCGQVPLEWKKALICPIWKGKGSSLDISQYRPISLTVVARKIFERCLLPIVSREAGPLDIAQGGFQKNKGTADQVFVFDSLLKHHTQNGEAPLSLFLDIKAAYDTVDRNLLWEKMRRRNVSDQVIRLLQSCFDDCKASIVIGNEKSDWIHLNVGLLQGSVLSPLLYCLFIDDLPAKIRAVGTDPPEEFTHNNVVLFADDIAVVAKDEQELQAICDVCNEHAEIHHYRFAPSKCVILKEPEGEVNITLHQEVIPVEESFKFLGSYFDHQGFMQTLHLDKMSQKAKTACNILKSTGVNGRAYSADVIITLYKSFVRPILEWGANLHLYHHKLLKQMDRTQMQILKSMLSLPNATSSDAILMLAKLETMKNRTMYLRARTLRRFSRNTRRMISRQCFEFCIDNPNPKFATKALHNSRAWDLFQTHAREQNVNRIVKRILIKEQMNAAHDSEALMSSLITPTAKMSPLFKARTTDPAIHITRSQKRLLILWRLGVLPLHPYKICKLCYRMDEDINQINIRPARRAHVALCYDFDNLLMEPPARNHVVHPDATRLDIWLDRLPPLPKEPVTIVTMEWQYIARFVEQMLANCIMDQDYRQTMLDLGLDPLLL